jgi:hypothetical protein
VRFDDRLSTVLAHPARTDHDRAVRWRQLVDLLARAGSLEDVSTQVSEALELIRSDAPSVDQQLRAATARAIAAMPIPFELIALFAQDELKVSAPILAAARLEPDQWDEIIRSSGPETAQFIRALHGKADAPPQQAPDTTTGPSIEDVINRIEALRASRAGPTGRADPTPQRADTEAEQPRADREPSAASIDAGSNLFRWECGPSGELEWVDGAPRAALIGRALVEPGHDRESGNGEIARAFAVRAPFSNALVCIGEETALAGDWEMSGMPAFEHASGRFAGYRGVAKRVRPALPAAASSPPPHPDAMRELVHEIKTPLNAIMGFAEIIQRQMFGPATQNYRSRAAEIVAQSHLLLTAIDDLDLAAKLQAGTYRAEIETQLAEVIEELAPQLEERARSADVQFRVLVEPHLPPCAVSGAVVQRLVERMVGALIDCSEPSEQLRLTASQWNESCALSVDRPAALKNLGEDDLLNPRFAVPRQRNSRLSLGFSLRLVRGIAQLAGGDLMVTPRKLTLLLARGDLRPPASRRYRQSAGRGL